MFSRIPKIELLTDENKLYVKHGRDSKIFDAKTS